MERLETTISWEARDPLRNMARAYRVSVTTDLFGWIMVERAWGRCGSRLRTVRQACATPEEAARLMRKVCRRRAGAAVRIGVPYRQI